MKSNFELSNQEYLLRVILYFLSGALPTAAVGLKAREDWLYILIASLGAGVITLRAYIDKSVPPDKSSEAQTRQDNDGTPAT